MRARRRGGAPPHRRGPAVPSAPRVYAVGGGDAERAGEYAGVPGGLARTCSHRRPSRHARRSMAGSVRAWREPVRIEHPRASARHRPADSPAVGTAKAWREPVRIGRLHAMPVVGWLGARGPGEDLFASDAFTPCPSSVGWERESLARTCLYRTPFRHARRPLAAIRTLARTCSHRTPPRQRAPPAGRRSRTVEAWREPARTQHLRARPPQRATDPRVPQPTSDPPPLDARRSQAPRAPAGRKRHQPSDIGEFLALYPNNSPNDPRAAPARPGRHPRPPDATAPTSPPLRQPVQRHFAPRCSSNGPGSSGPPTACSTSSPASACRRSDVSSRAITSPARCSPRPRSRRPTPPTRRAPRAPTAPRACCPSRYIGHGALTLRASFVAAVLSHGSAAASRGVLRWDGRIPQVTVTEARRRWRGCPCGTPDTRIVAIPSAATESSPRPCTQPLDLAASAPSPEPRCAAPSPGHPPRQHPASTPTSSHAPPSHRDAGAPRILIADGPAPRP